MANQIPHWMFAIRETLPANTIRALAMIVSHKETEHRVRQELLWSEELTPGAVDKLDYLGGCVQEAMRLWPTTPFIARQSLATSEQILILNTFNHRDSETNLMANAFYPEQWLGGSPPFPFNHLSSGTQACAGKDLALFLAKAALASVLRRNRLTLKRPRIRDGAPAPSMYNYFRTSFRVEQNAASF
jgi:cytochrome P450